MRHDDLDAALFALPLEQPPADLRASILAATVYRPVFPIRLWEAWTLGALAAVLVWLCSAIFTGGADRFAVTIQTIGYTLREIFSQPPTLLWIALGGGVACWLSMVNLVPAPAPKRVTRR